MKRFVICVLVFAAGVSFGASVSFASQRQKAYLRGVSDGLHQCHREAVMSGHGKWIAPGSPAPITFEWLPALDDYKPNTRINFPGALD